MKIRREPSVESHRLDAPANPSSPDSTYDVDVLVIGGGPAGLAAAISTAKESADDTRIKVIDKRTDLTRHQKVLLSRRTHRLLERANADMTQTGFQSLASTSVHAQEKGPVSRWMTDRMLHTLFKGFAPIAGVQRALQTGLSRQDGPVSLETGIEAKTIRVDGQGVNVTVQTAEGDTENIRAKYVVLAEGAMRGANEAGSLRQQLKVKTKALSEEFPGITAVVSEPAKVHGRYDLFELDGEPLRGYTLSDPSGTVFGFEYPQGRARDDASVQAFWQEIVKTLQLPVGPDAEAEVNLFTGQRTRADKLVVDDRVFIVGDNRGTDPVSLGQGTNRAIADGFRVGHTLGTLTDPQSSDFTHQVSLLRFALGSKLSLLRAAVLSKLGLMPRPAPAAADPADRQLKVRLQGEEPFRRTTEIRSELPPDEVWRLLTEAVSDSSKSPIWVHEYEHAWTVNPKTKAGATDAPGPGEAGTPSEGQNVGARYLHGRPLYYRLTQFDPDKRALKYWTLEGHPLTGGAGVQVLPAADGTGSILQWEVEYSGGKVAEAFGKLTTGYVFKRLDQKLRKYAQSWKAQHPEPSLPPRSEVAQPPRPSASARDTWLSPARTLTLRGPDGSSAVVRGEDEYKALIQKNRIAAGQPNADSEPLEAHIAIQGGGARIMVIESALQELMWQGVLPKSVSGTSAGAIIAALVATGSDPSTVENILAQWPKGKALMDFSAHPLRHGISDGVRLYDYLDQVLRTLTGIHDRPVTFADLPIPLSVCATVLSDSAQDAASLGSVEGRRFIFSQKTTPNTPVALAVRASSAVPGVFAPVQITDPLSGRAVQLVDGGLVDNLVTDTHDEGDCVIGLAAPTRKVLAGKAPQEPRSPVSPEPAGGDWLFSTLKASAQLRRSAGAAADTWRKLTSPKPGHFMVALPSENLHEADHTRHFLNFGAPQITDAVKQQARGIVSGFLKDSLSQLRNPEARWTNLTTDGLLSEPEEAPYAGI